MTEWKKFLEMQKYINIVATLSAGKIFSLNITVPGCYAYWYGDIQSDSHYNDYCLGREKLDMLCANNILKPKPERYRCKIYMEYYLIFLIYPIQPCQC